MKIYFLLVHLLLTLINSEEYSGAYNLILDDEKSTIDGEILTSDPIKGVSIKAGENIVHYESEYANVEGYGESTSQSEWHTKEECNKEKLVEITEPGTYIVSGKLNGQLSISIPDADENADDNTKKERYAKLILKNVDITCNVAPALIFYKAYEIDETEYEDNEIKIEYNDAYNLDFTNAGARIIIADDSENTIKGSHVAKCYKYTVNNDSSITVTTKKRAKYDGAFYSKVSMFISAEKEGNGILNIIADNEGLDTEKHLLIEKGNIYISSNDDGINTNEEGGSVTLLKGGKIVINGGLGTEGDGIDSNGYLIINGGELISAGKPQADSGMDADLGIVINGGTSIAVGTTMDNASNKSTQLAMNLHFSSQVEKTKTLTIKDTNGKVLISFNPSKAGFINNGEIRGYIGAIISHPDFKLNTTYYLYLDDSQLGYGGNNDRDPGNNVERKHEDNPLEKPGNNT